jgi:hypothetical protein
MDECAKVEHFSLDPVPDMNEWVLKLLGQKVKFIFEMGLRVSTNQLDVLVITQSHVCLFLVVFILLEEFGKLFVISKLCLFHGHNLTDVLLEVLEVAHQDLLLFDEIIDVIGVFAQHSLLLVGRRDSNVFVVIRKHSVRVCLLKAFQRVFYFSRGSQKHLDFGSFGQVVSFGELPQKLAEEVSSLLDKVFFCVSRSLLGWNWRNKDTGVPLKHNFSEQEELFESSGDVYFSQTVMAFNAIDGVFVRA